MKKTDTKTRFEKMMEIQERQREYDKKATLKAAMMNTGVEIKSLGVKRKHPLSPEYIRIN